MTDARKMIPRIEALIKRADPKAITARTFYDDASNRLYVTIVKGSRKTDITLLGDYLTGNHHEETERLIKEAVARLQHTPIG